MKDVFTINEAKKSKSLLRQIAETGSTTRNLAIELGILPADLQIPATQVIDRAQGIGHKDFPNVSKKARQGQWRIVENSKTVLESKGFC